MSNFKKQIAQQRTAVPQVDPESTKPSNPPMPIPTPISTPIPGEPLKPTKVEPEPQPAAAVPEATEPQRHAITCVDTSESPTNRGFFMYPSRHRQIAKDIAYIEDRRPWEIIDDALEEYVIKHYGKEYKRKV